MNKTIVIAHSSSIVAEGIQAFLANVYQGNISIYNNYYACLNATKFLQSLEESFVVIIEGTMLDAAKYEELAKHDKAALILCDLTVVQSSLLLALNSSGSYISLEDNDPQKLLLAAQCAIAGCVFICPQAKKTLERCVFEPRLAEREAIAQLREVDRQILALTAQGYTQSAIGEIVNYSSLSVGHRLREIICNLNLQTRQEAIALVNSIGLNLNTDDRDFQAA